MVVGIGCLNGVYMLFKWYLKRNISEDIKNNKAELTYEVRLNNLFFVHPESLRSRDYSGLKGLHGF
jgi:hypothetical protein